MPCFSFEGSSKEHASADLNSDGVSLVLVRRGLPSAPGTHQGWGPTTVGSLVTIHQGASSDGLIGGRLHSKNSEPLWYPVVLQIKKNVKMDGIGRLSKKSK